MRQEYQAQYRAEVETLAEKGFELYFLSGETLRAKTGKVNAGMPTEVAGQVSAMCRDSLALTEFSAEALAGRLSEPVESESQVSPEKDTLKAN